MNLSAYIAIHWSRTLKLLLIIAGISMAMGVQAQTIDDSVFIKPHRILTEIPEADQMVIDSEGNLILLDINKSCIYKYFVMADYDSMIVVGGKSHRSEGFLHPVKISAGNRQTLYLLDDVKRKLLLLNPNLKVIEEVDFLDLGENADRITEGVPIFPLNFTVSPTGGIYILSQEDNKIYFFDIHGNISRSFAGLDYGDGSLYEPTQLEITDKIETIVSDMARREFKIYDLYGNFKYAYAPEVNFEWENFLMYGNHLILFDNQNLYFGRLDNYRSNYQKSISTDRKLIDIQLDHSYIYLLYENEVHLYQYQNE